MGRKSFVCIYPEDRKPSQARFDGTRREIICDETTPTDRLVSGVVELVAPGCIINLHYHDIEELQFILFGSGVARDADSNEYPLFPGASVYCAPGPEGAHEFENTGDTPLGILFVFPSEGGKFPGITLVHKE
jgi:quercetin dioxygenase-like cupin family protein